MQNEWPIREIMFSVVPLVLTLLAGFLPSRHEPRSPLLASQLWHYRDIVIVLAVITALGLLPLSRLPIPAGRPPWASAVEVIIIASVWGVVRHKHDRPWRALGLDPNTALYQTLWSLRIALGITSVILLLRLSTLPGGVSWPASPESHAKFSDLLAAYFVVTVLGPFAEELFFRGLAYGPLLRKFGAVGATVGTAALWSVTHVSDMSYSSVSKIVFTLIVGMVFAEVYRRRQSLVPTVMFHIVSNTMAMSLSARYRTALIPVTGVSVALWLISVVLLNIAKRSQTTQNSKTMADSV